jgi:hypothetical protein
MFGQRFDLDVAFNLPISQHAHVQILQVRVDLYFVSLKSA